MQELSLANARKSLMLRAWIGSGLFFMALPGTLMGFSNLMAISTHHGLGNLPAAWMEGHGHAQMFGWIGSFILGIGFYSQPAHGRSVLVCRSPAVFCGYPALRCAGFGLIFMVILSMLPVGLLQAWASIEHGTWYARSSEFMQSSSMQTLRWMRIPGDILFAIGAALFAWFVLGLLTGHSIDDKSATGRSIEVEEQEVALAGR